jgi:hypothetical protein
MAARPESGSDSVGVRIEPVWIRLQLLALEVQVTDRLDRYEVHVDVTHFDSSNDHPHLRGPEGDVNGLGYIPADLHQMVQQIRLEVDPVVDFPARDNQSMTGIERRAGKKCDDEIVTPHESGGQVTAHHLCKD